MRLRPLTEAECYARCYDGRSVESSDFAHAAYDGRALAASGDRHGALIDEIALERFGARREAA